MKLHSLLVATSLLFATACVAPAESSPDALHSELQGSVSVSGRILFEPTATIPGSWAMKPASGVVQIVDTTLADAPSVEIASAPFTATNGAPIPFSIPVSGFDARRSYTVQVHLDADGSASVTTGDFITMDSFPVLTGGHTSVVDVTIEQVGGTAAPPSTVSGKILLSGSMTGITFPFSGKVDVLDVTYADAPSIVVGTQSVLLTGPGPIAFAVPVGAIDPKASYSVYVHLDADGDDQVSEGDFLTMESFPVLTRGYGSVVDVTARRY